MSQIIRLLGLDPSFVWARHFDADAGINKNETKVAVIVSVCSAVILTLVILVFSLVLHRNRKRMRSLYEGNLIFVLFFNYFIILLNYILDASSVEIFNLFFN